MLKKMLISVVSASFLFAGVTGETPHAEHEHWNYLNVSHWGDIDPKFRMCQFGVNQSPVDLNRFVEAELDKLQITYAGNAKSVVNNGHTIKVETMGKNVVIVDGKPFKLLQFHFHTPSENKIVGKQFPMEAHFVHKSEDGEYLVIALMFEEGRKSSALDKVFYDLDSKVGHKKALSQMFNPGEFFPKKLDYYRYDGSFTTPPCTEGVRWIVLKSSVEASKEQLQRMHSLMGDNNRPTQPLKARVILK